MTRHALIVAHGQPSDPEPPEAEMAALARNVAGRLPDWRIGSATLAASESLKNALQPSDNALIFPFFMADGWFIRSLLPRRLAEAGAPDARILTPFGLLPGTAELAADILTDALVTQGWQPEETTLILAAHGSGRSPRPATAARSLQTAISSRLAFADCRLGFIEEAPELVEVAGDVGKRALCLPLFVARWGHVTDDIPAALHAAGFQGVTLPPLGTDARVPQLIAEAIAAA
ncbi:CbiX/SirB N-terminal domain-containing protein [Defluviimonas sp. SAOS-178_SWC]|uniref:CbiX/SirB N-terminal domain-containing protein n=1 Tax=Defluviimonas sp. SAOS-178_SWC TaxID=3121287 RepID=UPI0032213AC7